MLEGGCHKMPRYLGALGMMGVEHEELAAIGGAGWLGGLGCMTPRGVGGRRTSCCVSVYLPYHFF